MNSDITRYGTGPRMSEAAAYNGILWVAGQLGTPGASVAEQTRGCLAEVDRIRRGYFADRDSFEPVSREDLLERVASGLVTVLDVRPQDEFGQGHLPGAVNIPLGELQDRLAELDPDREVIAYCRGAYCVFAFEAVAALRAQGRPARRLVDGFPEWKAAGLPVATSF